MSYSQKTKKEVIYICPDCKIEVSDNENSWISTYNQCPKCKKYVMRAKEKGNFFNYKDYNGKESLGITNIKFSHNYFFQYTESCFYDKEKDELVIQLDMEKIKNETLRRLGNQCRIQNIDLPKNIKIEIKET